ncbi:MAG TPA: Cys-tRNA(Pro) deacylase [Actinobacteria bacterium]|jgi:Cys-tRNA(Pro)/Cys-tRNA(Cys) deacylase|nr:Cys-tRNA(Pro) deacylase [Actinomycetota bacterium]
MAAKAGGTPATLALTRAGVEFSRHTYDHDPRASSYGLEAAAALGLDPAQVFKTLIADIDGDLVVAVVPVAGSLDLKALATAAGGRRAEMADPARAQRITGYVLGGISPLGQKRALPTYIDSTAAELTKVYVSGGRRGLDLGLDPTDLIEITKAVVAPIGRPDASPAASHPAPGR